MSKEYFPHDYGARSDLRCIRKDYGLEGVGFYWCFVEILHENGGYIGENELESVAFELNTDADMVSSIVHNYDKFIIKKSMITSNRVLRNIKRRDKIADERRKAANMRWSTSGDNTSTVELGDEERAMDTELSKQFYIEAIERGFQNFLDNADTNTLFSRNIYDYKSTFDLIIEEVRDKDYLIIGRKNVPTYRFLQVIQKHIKQNGDISNLEQAVNDVQERYILGKIKNRKKYLMATLYNAALIDG